MLVKIYCIEDCNGLKYIGSTKSKLNKRLSHHRSHNQCMSRELNLDDCKIYTLEECEEEDRKVREQYWIDHIECVNKNNTIHNRKEYYQKNRDKIKERKKNYHQENRDKILQQKKIYHQENRDRNIKQMNNRYHFQNSWGGDPRYNNNLLKIDLNIFL
jgi:hypothetical protein